MNESSDSNIPISESNPGGDIRICNSPWCKGVYIAPANWENTVCPMCKSFDDELSGGVTWKDINYAGDRFDKTAHHIDIKIKKF
jgi:hypothetical protein